MEIRRSHERGHANHGWLNSNHTFSFASYYDPKQTGFSDLLVLNDDKVAPKRGFGEHPHRDMEIFTYVIDGALQHSDSMGNGDVIKPGDVQIMSAGTGILHSEFNPSQEQPVHFLQIWVTPNEKNITPRYDQKHFSPEEKQGKFKLIISPDGAHDSLKINQDTRVYAGLFNGNEHAVLTFEPNRHAYVQMVKGSADINGEPFNAGDGARIRHVDKVEVKNGKDAEVLVFDLRPHESPAGY